MNIYNTNKRTSRLVSKGFLLVSYPSITHLWFDEQIDPPGNCKKVATGKKQQIFLKICLIITVRQ